MAQTGGTGGGPADPAPVDVRVQRGLRLLGTAVLAPLAVGILLAILQALRTGNPGAPMERSGWSAYVALGWAVSVVLLVAAVVTVWVLWSYRVHLDQREVSWRLMAVRRSTSLAEVTGIEVLASRPRSIAGDEPGALVLRGEHGRVVATLRPAETQWAQVLAVLSAWVRRRPELVSDERTAALFVAAEGPQAAGSG